MAVSLVDNPGADQGNTSSITSFNYTGLTISSGLANSAAIFAIAWNGNPTNISVTWNGVACTQISFNHATGLGSLALYGILTPASGNQTLAVSWTTALPIQVVGCSFSGVSSFANSTMYNSSGTATTGPNTINVTTAIADYTFGATALGQNGGSPPFTSSPSGTTICTDDQTATTGVYFTALAVASTGTSTSYTGRNGATADQMVIADVDLVAAIGWAAAEY